MKAQLIIINSLIWCAVVIAFLAWNAPTCTPKSTGILIGGVILVAGCR